MKKTTVLSVLIVVGGAATAIASDAGSSAKPIEDRNTYVIIVSGIHKDPAEQRSKDRVVTNLRSFLLKAAGVGTERLRVLTGPASQVQGEAQASSAENLKKTMEAFGGSISPQDRFIFYYAGQANVIGENLRLNLPGNDITHRQLAEWINTIRASSILVVLDCPAAGMAVKSMAGKGRVVVCGCTAEQHYSTRFGEYFVPALHDAGSDADGDGRVSLLEAFTLACRQLDDWYRQQKLLKTETAGLEDNGDGVPSPQPWRYKQEKTDGMLASRFFLVPK